MKIIATSDTHFPFDVLPHGDVLIHAGDLMMSGTPGEWYPRLESLKAQPHPVKFYVPGNHDFHVELYEGVSAVELRKGAGTKLLGLNRPVTDIDGLRILGLPWVTNLHGWAFNRNEEWLDGYLDAVTETYGAIDVVVSHAPMYRMLDAIYPEVPDFHRQKHVGCEAYSRWFNKLDADQRPKVWINGHIHESYGHTTQDGCRFYNVAMCDQDYNQSNPAIIIEV